MGVPFCWTANQLFRVMLNLPADENKFAGIIHFQIREKIPCHLSKINFLILFHCF